MTETPATSSVWTTIEEHKPLLMKMCRKAAHGDMQRAEELFSDEVIRMMPALLERYDGVRPFINYMSAYFRFHLRKIQRRVDLRAQQQTSYSDCHDLNSIDGAHSQQTANHADRIEVVDHVEACLDCLNEKQRFVVVHCYLKGQTYREVAAQLGCSHAYIVCIMAAAMRKMKCHVTS